MALLFADENFPAPTVDARRQLGHDVLTVAESNLAGLGVPDEDVLAFAHAGGRAVLTHNRKRFRHLHNAGYPHSGMILCTEDTDFASLAVRIDRAVAQVVHLSGQLIRITRTRT